MPFSVNIYQMMPLLFASMEAYSQLIASALAMQYCICVAYTYAGEILVKIHSYSQSFLSVISPLNWK